MQYRGALKIEMPRILHSVLADSRRTPRDPVEKDKKIVDRNRRTSKLLVWSNFWLAQVHRSIPATSRSSSVISESVEQKDARPRHIQSPAQAAVWFHDGVLWKQLFQTVWESAENSMVRDNAQELRGKIFGWLSGPEFCEAKFSISAMIHHFILSFSFK